MHPASHTLPENIGIALAFVASAKDAKADLLTTPSQHEYVWNGCRKYARNPDIRLPSQLKDATAAQDLKTIADKYWKNLCGPGQLSRQTKLLCTEAKERRIDVRRTATLQDLRDLGQKKTVIVIMAHWRGHAIQDYHWHGSPSITMSLLQQKTAAVVRGLRTMGYDAAASELEAVGTGDLEVLRSALNALITNAAVRLYAQTEDEKEVEALGDRPNTWGDHCARNRIAIDVAYGPEMLAPGNRLELRDGFHDLASLRAALPVTVNGLILMACHSAFVMEGFELADGSRRIRATPEAVEPGLALAMLIYGVRTLAKSGGNLFEILDSVPRTLDT